MQKPILHTARLELQPTAPHLFAGLWAAIQRSLPELSPWMDWAVAPDAEQTREFVEKAEKRWDTGGDRPFTILKDGQVIGQCSLDGVNPLANHCEIGYWLRTDHCRQGLMTEAVSAVVHFGFSVVGLHRIELHAGTENVGSIRVAEKVGFLREGVCRERGLGGGGYHDMYVYGLLAHYERLRPGL